MCWVQKILRPSRGTALALALIGLGALSLIQPVTADTGEETLTTRFEYLSQNGNSNCSAEFLSSIAAMPPMARLQGSCCSPMDAHRYVEQVEGLKKYKHIAAIPSDPYDIPAGLAQKLLPSYELDLSATEQAAYDFAMANSDEQGPCCCGCWRWQAYGGLAKLLIREHGFSGEQIAEIWDLSDGCGGGDDHNHS
jgi:hypothetical protein